MLGNGHVRFGGRVGETDRRQRRHRAPARPDPSARETTRVLSPLNDKPLGASHAASRALTSSASCLVWQRATKSSAYLIRTGEPIIAFPTLVPVW
jgi:hypothetical protein